jgi:hypothetical protein
MPIHRPLQNLSLNQDDIDRLAAACEEALRALHKSDRDDPIAMGQKFVSGDNNDYAGAVKATQWERAPSISATRPTKRLTSRALAAAIDAAVPQARYEHGTLKWVSGGSLRHEAK